MCLPQTQNQFISTPSQKSTELYNGQTDRQIALLLSLFKWYLCYILARQHNIRQCRYQKSKGTRVPSSLSHHASTDVPRHDEADREAVVRRQVFAVHLVRQQNVCRLIHAHLCSTTLCVCVFGFCFFFVVKSFVFGFCFFFKRTYRNRGQ